MAIYEAVNFGRTPSAWGVAERPEGRILESSPNWGKKEAEYVAARYNEVHAAAVKNERARTRRELLQWAEVMEAPPEARITRANLEARLDLVCPEEG